MKNRLSFINIFIVIYTVAALCYNSANESISSLGFVLILAALGMCALEFARMKCRNIPLKIIVVIVLIVAINCVLLLMNPTARAARSFIVFLASPVVFLAFACTDVLQLNERLCKILVLIETLAVVAAYFWGNNFSDVDDGFRGLFSTTTFMGLFSCVVIQVCCLFYNKSQYKEKIWILIAVVQFVLIWNSKVRTAILAASIIFLYEIYSILRKDRKNFWLNNSIKWICFGAIIAIVAVYPNLQQFSFYENLTDWVYKLTGKDLLTGRDVIWVEALAVIVKSPWIGYGMDYSHVFSTAIHNSYLNIFLSGGLVSFSFIFIFINMAINGMQQVKTRIFETLFVFTLVNLLICTAENLLFGGQIIFQVFLWAIMGLGNNQCIKDQELAMLNHEN